MKAIHYALFITLCLCLPAFAPPDRPAYQLFTRQGKPTTYQKLLKQAADADVILFGELHNNPICHWLALQLTRDLYNLRKERLVLGAEMFETDNQSALTAYTEGRLTDKEFAGQARLWPNYTTDYRPLVDFARSNKIPFIATNIPRRYASLVARQGLAALDTVRAANLQLMTPLPLEVDLTLPGYQGMLDMMKGDHSPMPGKTDTQTPPSDMAANFARAQAIKDATMAHFISTNWQPGRTLLHVNGDYHSKNFEGISWYLRKKRADLRILTISSVETMDVRSLTGEQVNLANIILAIPADMTKTY